jgi:hypothetical protein
MAGFSSHRLTLFAGAQSRKVQLHGGRVLVLYGVAPATLSQHPRERLYGDIAWKIFRTGTDVATVRLMTPSERYDVYLEKTAGEWFVVFRELQWIS